MDQVAKAAKAERDAALSEARWKEELYRAMESCLSPDTFLETLRDRIEAKR